MKSPPPKKFRDQSM